MWVCGGEGGGGGRHSVFKKYYYYYLTCEINRVIFICENICFENGLLLHKYCLYMNKKIILIFAQFSDN